MKFIKLLYDNFKRHKRNTKPICSDRTFEIKPMDQAGRVVACYRGLLPKTPAFRHILLVSHLRKLPGERLEPYQFSPGSTHELWIWYQSRSGGPKKLLYRCQFDAGIELLEAAKGGTLEQIKDAESQVDGCARFVARVIADRLVNSTEYGATLAGKDNNWFWSLAVERAILKCRESHAPR